MRPHVNFLTQVIRTRVTTNSYTNKNPIISIRFHSVRSIASKIEVFINIRRWMSRTFLFMSQHIASIRFRYDIFFAIASHLEVSTISPEHPTSYPLSLSRKYIKYTIHNPYFNSFSLQYSISY